MPASIQSMAPAHFSIDLTLSPPSSPLSQAPLHFTALFRRLGSESSLQSTAKGLYLITMLCDVTYPRQLRHYGLLRTELPLGDRFQQPGMQLHASVGSRPGSCAPSKAGCQHPAHSSSCLGSQENWRVIVSGGYQPLRVSLPHREPVNFCISSWQKCVQKKTQGLQVQQFQASPILMSITSHTLSSN